MIAKINKAYVRRYSDSGQVTAYVEGVDDKGKSFRTEAAPYAQQRKNAPMTVTFGHHMHALFARAAREGVRLRRETW